MNESTEVLSKLVVGRKRDGRCQYDPAAKRELVLQCKQPGVSVSRIAMQHGINANLLRAWIAKSLVSDSTSVKESTQSSKADTLPSFVAVQIESTAKPAKPALSTAADRAVRAPRSTPATPPLRLHACLPNGVNLEIDLARSDALMPVIQMLNALPCSS